MRRICAIAAAIVGLGAAAADAIAQSPSGPARIGYLEHYATAAGWAEAFQHGLRALGYAENRNIVIERRSAAGQTERLPELAAELVRLQPHVIVALNFDAALAVKNATAAIPIVMANTTDPVGLGLVASLARPGGNITGLSTLAPGLMGKRLELLSEVVPGLTSVGVIADTTGESSRINSRELQAAAMASSVAFESFEVRRLEDFDAAFEAAAARVGGVIVLNSPVLRAHPAAVAAAAARHKVPAIYFDAEFVDAGGLLAYGASIPDLYRRAAIIVDKILKGAKPADLPIEQPTKFDMVVNLKAATALGLVIPQLVLIRADVVNE